MRILKFQDALWNLMEHFRGQKIALCAQKKNFSPYAKVGQTL